jgi:hypothetical protein
MRVVAGQLINGLPCSVQCVRRMIGLASPSADLGIHRVRTRPDSVAPAFMGFDCRRACDFSGSLQIIGSVQGHHSLASLDRRSVTTPSRCC